MSAAAAFPPLRPLGGTGAEVLPFSLGGEGVLRTVGRAKEAIPVILEALRLGVRYCDTAPAYSQSQDYYGQAFLEAGPEARAQVVLASKTHERSRSGALRLLEDSLRRLGTSHLDVWQLHDLRTHEDLDLIFGRGGAIEAVEEAKAQGLIRFVGLTGHHDPEVLLEAMRRYRFDTVLVAINPADGRRLPFIPSVVREARAQGMGVVAMKALAAGQIPRDGTAPVAELLRYAASLADTAVIGCSTVAEVRENMQAALQFTPMSEDEKQSLERRLSARAGYDYFKRP
jgi:aryl-alcohol dehydrogenase-like predicted oxidoreductase